MRKTIWIINHYASDQFIEGAGRHHWFGKYLIKKGYNVKIFCASTLHARGAEIEISNSLLEEKMGADEVPYCIVKTSRYKGNGLSRIFNMLSFYNNVKKAMGVLKKKEGKPDVILASSVHPLTLVAGIQFGKKNHIPCICEVRDLWPLTLEEFGLLRKKRIITSLLYKGEKWIYKNADRIVFTMSKGKQYIIDKGWENVVDIKKIYYINNGIDVDDYQGRISSGAFKDEDLDSDYYKIVYTGSMGEPNQIDKIVCAAEEVSSIKENVRFILFGEGSLKEKYKQYCNEKGIKNIVFKNKVERTMIPYILEKCDITIFTMKDLDLYKYGISTNKIFDYLASGKPIVSNSEAIYSIVGDSSCALISNDLKTGILKALAWSKDEYCMRCTATKDVLTKYTSHFLTEKLISIIEELL